MKKGFALLETLIVITFLSVSMLVVYKNFSNMIVNNKRQVLYDDVSDIYNVYYLKEYLYKYKLTNINNLDYQELTCEDFSTESCFILLNKLNINKMYLIKYDKKQIEIDNSSLNNYLKTLSNKEDYNYRLLIEFNNNDNYRYASLGVENSYE